MALTPGTRLGSYAVLSAIGAGGMGEVYRARDAKLNRDVAIKVLPELFALDGDRLMRFEREAQTLAAMNHPNIAQVYGVLEQPAALVMEFVDGEDLAQRIDRGAMPLDEALPIARQIAEALEAAHERGIIHRDLKPPNIRVRPDGTVKVLDFGLAKAEVPSDASHPHLQNSPTFTSPARVRQGYGEAGTEIGVILGTAAYMAPEQAKGKVVDKRADIWAFGCVVYEMLSGSRPFPGSDVTETLASVLARDVDWDRLPSTVPPHVRALVRACLQKDPRERLRDIGDARLQMEAPSDPPAAAAIVVAKPLVFRALPWAIAAVAAAIAAVPAVWSRTSETPLPLHLSIALPHGHRVTSGPVITRDGRRIVFASGTGAGQPRLYMRDITAFDLRELPGTEGASRPFFSPDGRRLGFFANGRLFTLELAGGSPSPVAAAPSPGGGTWGEDGTIVFVPTWNGGLYRLRPGGGEELILAPDPAKKEYAYTAPLLLPGGRDLLFSVWGAQFSIARVTLPGLERGVAAADFWTSAVYAPTGHLLFGNNQGNVQALPYPPRDAVPVSVLDNVHWSGGSGDGVVNFAVSETGTLVYAPGDIGQRSLAIVDETGRAEPVPAEPAVYLDVRISPDGRRAATAQNSELWVVDLERGGRAPVAPQGSGAQAGITWSRDGSRVFFGSNLDGNWDIYAARVSALGTSERVLRRDLDQYPLSEAPDGTLLFMEVRPGMGNDLWTLSPDGSAKAWLATAADEQEGAFSRDGRLIAYRSNASGRDQVYVQGREGGSVSLQISTNGGAGPAWSPVGDRLFYREGNTMMAVDIETRAGLSASRPRRLFDGGWTLPSDALFAVMPDGRRFLMIHFAPAAIPTRLDVVFNWFDELRKRAPLH